MAAREARNSELEDLGEEEAAVARPVDEQGLLPPPDGDSGGDDEAALPQLCDAQALRRMFAVNADIFVRTLCLLSAVAAITAKAASFGDVTLAAYEVRAWSQRHNTRAGVAVAAAIDDLRYDSAPVTRVMGLAHSVALAEARCDGDDSGLCVCVFAPNVRVRRSLCQRWKRSTGRTKSVPRLSLSPPHPTTLC